MANFLAWAYLQINTLSCYQFCHGEASSTEPPETEKKEKKEKDGLGPVRPRLSRPFPSDPVRSRQIPSVPVRSRLWNRYNSFY
ncbi:hypothetical protein CI610_03722 [invertebrate metagenome]|uniref:Uncharacterized protein n=1 Tax=invertebrate metagenome TaxID=1711999 RepID=A0A2H9T2C2_9ZZZZ